MPKMSLKNLVIFTLPEGFLTSKKIYTIFVPSSTIRTHRVRDSTNLPTTKILVNTIRTAYDVIISIAIEPIVARYIMDSRLTRGRPREYLDVLYSDTMPRLFVDFPHLK